MSVRAKFDALVKGLDAEGLRQLGESVAAEMEGRSAESETTGVDIAVIRPGMSAEEKELATREIARVLREG